MTKEEKINISTIISYLFILISIAIWMILGQFEVDNAIKTTIVFCCLSITYISSLYAIYLKYIKN